MTLLAVLLALVAATLAHVSVMAIVPAFLGIRPIAVSYGLGPLLLQRGKIQIRAMLVGGYVKFPDSRDTELEPDQLEEAIDRRPLWLHSAVILLPQLVVLAVGSALYGRNPIVVVKDVWTHFILSAAGPLSTAQIHLETFASFANSNSPIVVFGWLLALVASLALLPFGSAAGGQLILNAISGRRSPHALTDQLNLWTNVVHILLLASWCVAILVFVWHLF